MVVGTVGYMSPEQARGRPTDGRSDLFSLGCVLYEMATGQEPFSGADPMARLTALALHDPILPQKIRPTLPSALGELILWMLAKDPQDRPRSAQAVADALRAIEQQRISNSSLRLQSGSAATAEPALSESTLRPDKASPFSFWVRMGIFVLLVALTAVSFHLGQLLLARWR
jgi:serine/threonine protein kinase